MNGDTRALMSYRTIVGLAFVPDLNTLECLDDQHPATAMRAKTAFLIVFGQVILVALVGERGGGWHIEKCPA